MTPAGRSARMFQRAGAPDAIVIAVYAAVSRLHIWLLRLSFDLIYPFRYK